MYEQSDGVIILSSPGVVLANMMTEWEKVIAESLIKNWFVKYCARYGDDTLLVIKRQDVDFIQ